MNRITVPGGWIEFRDPEEVPEGRRREVMKLSSRGAKYADLYDADGNVTGEMNDGDREAVMEFMVEFNDAVAYALLHAWSWDIPVSKAALLDLPGAVYDAIVKHCSPLATRLMPTFSADGAADPKAPTENF